MTKLIIQIPCYNEAEALPQTLRTLPRRLDGIDSIEWLVIDDGSRDQTADVARANGVDHIISHTRNLGLARAFATGLEASIGLGADVIVNTDADNQYDAADLPKLIAPILDGTADLVIGERPIASVAHFSPIKKLLQRVGSLVVRIASGTSVPDAPSGFRALSRRAAARTHVFSDHTYTLETIIQAGRQGLTMTSVPIRTNPYTRPSRLIRSTSSYVLRSTLTILRIFVTYRPFLFFSLPAALFSLAGGVLGVRFVWYFLAGEGQGHVQSLILTAILLGAGGLSFAVALLADLIAVNRKLLEHVENRLFDLLEKGATHA